jgi:hypothetical protein
MRELAECYIEKLLDDLVAYRPFTCGDSFKDELLGAALLFCHAGIE